MDLKELIIKVQSGDKEAWNEIDRLYRNKLINYCRKWFKKTEDAEEATQEILLICYRKISQLQNPEKFESWLYTIAINKCNEISNKNKRSPVLISDINAEDEVLSYIENLKDNDSNIQPEEKYEKKEQFKILINILDEIPKEQKVCFSLRIIYNKPFTEIAEKTGVSVPTAKSRYIYAKKSMKKKILQYEKDNRCKIHSGFIVSPALLFKSFFATNSIAGFITSTSGIITAAAVLLSATVITGVALNPPDYNTENVIDSSVSENEEDDTYLVLGVSEVMGETEPTTKGLTPYFEGYSINNPTKAEETTINSYEEISSNKVKATSKNPTEPTTNNNIKTTKTKTKPKKETKKNTTTNSIQNTKEVHELSGAIYLKPSSYLSGNIYFHIYDLETGTPYYDWHTKNEKATYDYNKEMYVYNISDLADSNNHNGIMLSSTEYRIIVSDTDGNQTEEIFFNESKIGRVITIEGYAGNSGPDDGGSKILDCHWTY